MLKNHKSRVKSKIGEENGEKAAPEGVEIRGRRVFFLMQNAFKTHP
jgi:hypothetical protein